jgi:hypothetical protein
MRKSFLILGLLFPTVAVAATPSLTNITKADAEAIGEEMSSNFSHASVMGAEPLGDIFGFEVSLVGGQNASPEMDKLVKKAGGSGLDKLYHAGILAAVSIPFGLTGEVVYTPKTSAQDINFQLTSMALKLTLNEELLTVIPFNFAIRAFQTNSSLDFKQTVATIEGTVENKNSVTGLQLLFSPDIPMVEPYFGIGYLQAKNTIGSTPFSIYNQSEVQGSSYEASLSTTQTLIGLNFYVLFFSLGAEYARAFDSDRYTAKLGFYF